MPNSVITNGKRNMRQKHEELSDAATNDIKLELEDNERQVGLAIRRSLKLTSNHNSSKRNQAKMSLLPPFSCSRRCFRIGSYGKSILYLACMVVSMLTLSAQSSESFSSSSPPVPPKSIAIGQLTSLGQQQQQQQQLSANFDASHYKSIQEAIRNHPDLREFGTLCELDGVKEIVSMDRTPLTVFAPIDRSLGDVLAKAKSRSINLIELARHHIAQGFIAPEEGTKYPFKFTTYSLLSPLYLNQVQTSRSPSSGGQLTNTAVFVNNAKILATYLIPIDGDQYQTLHVIDQVIEFAYVNRKSQFRSGPAQSGPSSSGSQLMMGLSSSLAGKKTTTTTTIKKAAFNLDDLMNNDQGANVEGLVEYYERFGDLMASQPQVDLFHARALKGNSYQQEQQRLTLDPSEFKLDRLARVLRQQYLQAQSKLKGKLVQLDETSNSLNTYFLPMNNDDLDKLLELPLTGSSALLPFEALVIPNQVLFTRTMSLGVPHLSSFDQTSGQRVSLSLAKSLPVDQVVLQEASEGFAVDNGSLEELSRKLLATPLLLQATCTGLSAPGLASLTSSEILVANIPLSNGVLHLIKKPIVVTSTKVLDYLNDSDNQLSDLVNSIGSRTGTTSKVSLPPAKVNRFRELLARERQMLSAFTMDQTMNKTILAPSDEAFARLRYDLRALVQNDESMIPKHWDNSYRRDLLERLIKRHVVLHQTITSDQIDPQTGAQAISDNGKQLNFRQLNGEQFLIESDSMEAHLVHHDLIGTNGVLHIIDRVLGEEQETVYSLLKSMVLKFVHSIEQENQQQQTTTTTTSGGAGLSSTNQLQSDLNRLIESNLKRSQESISNSQQTSSNTLGQSTNNEQPQMTSLEETQRSSNSNELAIISKSIGQYLDELASSNRRQVQLLGSSVNISYQLARLTSLAEGLDDWNDKFKSTERTFTYFVPSDLAWLRLQQAQPELYKPLLYFLDQQQQQQQQHLPQVKSAQEELESQLSNANQSLELAPLGRSARSSESSHRLRQILERHLVVNRKFSKRDLDQMDSVQTIGATLRLVEAPQQQHLTAATFSDALDSTAAGNFAALHSISGQQGSPSSSYNNAAFAGAQLTRPPKSIKFGDSALANIVQVNEASNGFVYVIDGVLLQSDDPGYIVQTSSTTAISSSMSSLLGAHNSAILDFIHNLLAPSPFNMSVQSTVALLGTLLLLIMALVLIATLLLVRRRNRNKLNQHRQLESGLTSSSSANSGSTSTTKSL